MNKIRTKALDNRGSSIMLSDIGATVVINQKIVCLFFRIHSAGRLPLLRIDILSFDKSG